MAAATTAEQNLADRLRDYAKQLYSLNIQVAEALALNTRLGTTWTGVTFTNRPYVGDDVSNILGSLTQFQNLLGNAAVTEGDHLTNVIAMASPLEP